MEESNVNETHKNDGIVAESKLSINLLNVDIKKLFISSLRGLIHLKLGDQSGVADAVIDLSEAVGINSPISRLAFKLYTTAMNAALNDVADRLFDLLSYDSEQQFDLGCTFDDVTIPKSFSFDRKSIDDPCNTDFYTEIERFISTALKKMEFSSSIISAVEKGMQKSFKQELQSEWRESIKYRELRDYFITPFDAAVADESAWDAYADRLRGNINTSLFGEQYSLNDIYTPLNAYYCEEADNSMHRATQKKEMRYVCDLNALLEKWLDMNDSNDAYRIISGEPGSGKSAFTKKFAADHIDNTRLVYVPLDKLSIEGQFSIQFSNFAQQEGLSADILEREKKILIILDGLDELTALGQAAANAAYRFVSNVHTTIDSLNSRGKKIFVIISGRIPSIQEASSLFVNNPKQLLHLLPYYMHSSLLRKSSQSYEYVDDDKLLIDYRKIWWSKYAIATNNNISDEIPKELLASDLKELTSSPLLLHLMAICYTEDGSIPINRAELYKMLLEGVYNRAPKTVKRENRHPLTRLFKSADEFIEVLSDVAVAMWHSSGRQVTLETVETYCNKNNHGELLKKLKEVAGAGGAIGLFMAFYSRKAEHIGDKESFEFTHKSFGEYLVARRVVDKLGRICDDLNNKQLGERVSLTTELENWFDLCGATKLDAAQERLISDHVALYQHNIVSKWQYTIIKLMEYSANNGYPNPRERQPLNDEMRCVRNAEIALLVMHSACAHITKKALDITWQEETTAGAWLKRIQGNEDDTMFLVNKCLAYINFTKCRLPFVMFMRADLTGCVFYDAFLYGANFYFAIIENSVFNKCKLYDANFHNANISHQEFIDCDFGNVDFRSEFRKLKKRETIEFSSCRVGGMVIHKSSDVFKKLCDKYSSRKSISKSRTIVIKDDLET